MDKVFFTRALIIDANEQHQKVIAGSLQRLIEGVTTTTLNPVQSALPAPDYAWADIDLLLVDVGEDHVAVMNWFSDLASRVGMPPTIFLDCQASSDAAVDFMRAGAVDYLNKRGLSDDRLMRALQAAWRCLQDGKNTGAGARAGKAHGFADAGSGKSDTPKSSRPDADVEDSPAWFKLPSISDDFPITPDEINAGTATMGKYQIVEFLGAGSSTQVFKAVAAGDSTAVALKILSPTKAGGEQSRDRFVREYELVKDIDNKHIIQIYEQHSDGEWPYMVMEYCARGDLGARMQHKLACEQAVKYAAQIAVGLHVAHEAGLVHRDIKPSNILFREDNTLVLVDFGIVKPRSKDLQEMTDEGKMVGTPSYISPEQARGEKLDGRSDLYALGVILFEMIEGRRPFTGATPIDVIFAHVQDPIPQLSQRQGALNDVVGRLLAKDRNERYATGKEVVAALRAACPQVAVASL